MKRLIAFALALAVVFGVSFALYKPERIGENTAAESVDFVWMDSDKSVLSRAAYAADALPETLTAPEHAALLVVTLHNADGRTVRTLCTQDDLFARAYVPSMLSGLLRVVDVSLDWGENGT